METLPAGGPGCSNSMQFALAARAISRQLASRRLSVPNFRCPPRLTGANRTLRRRADGAAIIAVRLAGRPTASVFEDMIEGVVVALRVTGAPADALRHDLWLALEQANAGDDVYRSGKARVA